MLPLVWPRARPCDLHGFWQIAGQTRFIPNNCHFNGKETIANPYTSGDSMENLDRGALDKSIGIGRLMSHCMILTESAVHLRPESSGLPLLEWGCPGSDDVGEDQKSPGSYWVASKQVLRHLWHCLARLKVWHAGHKATVSAVTPQLRSDIFGGA